MAKYDMLRVSLFGGYNKDDVHSYIQSLENELESQKVLHQRELGALQAKLDNQEEWKEKADEQKELTKEMETQAEELKRTREELGRMREELNRSRKACAKAQAELADRERIITEQKQTLLEQEKRLQEEKDRLETWKIQSKQEQKAGVENQKDTDRIQELEKVNAAMKQEMEQLKMRLQQGEAHKQEDYGFLDVDTIRKVLEDANENARMIREDAEQERQEILQEARQEAEIQKKNIASQIHIELEEKGIQLIAARHKIDRYVKELKNAQQGLYMIYTRMNQMVENMPVRADKYWEEEDKWMLPESPKEELSQKSEDTSADSSKEVQGKAIS